MFEQEENKLEFTANMTILPENNTALYAVGDVTVDRLFVIHDVKVLYFQAEGSEERRLGVCLPRHYNKKKDSWDSVLKLTPEQKEGFEKAVAIDINGKLSSVLSYVNECTKVQIRLSSENFFPTLAYADMTYRNMFTVRGIRLMDPGDGTLGILFPANQQGDGKFNSLLGTVSKEHRGLIDTVISQAFQEEYRKQKGHEYVFKVTSQKPEEKKTADMKGR